MGAKESYSTENGLRITTSTHKGADSIWREMVSSFRTICSQGIDNDGVVDGVRITDGVLLSDVEDKWNENTKTMKTDKFDKTKLIYHTIFISTRV